MPVHAGGRRSFVDDEPRPERKRLGEVGDGPAPKAFDSAAFDVDLGRLLHHGNLTMTNTVSYRLPLRNVVMRHSCTYNPPL